MATLPCNNGKWSLGHYSRLEGEFTTYTGSYNTAVEACAAAKLKAWVYDSAKKVYVPYNPGMKFDRVECADENNSYKIDNTYHVAFRHSPLELTISSAGKQLPYPIKVLVRKVVTVSPSKSVTSWSVTGEGSLITNVQKSDKSLTFTTKAPGVVTITAQSVCGKKSKVVGIKRDIRHEYISALWPALEKAGITKNKNELAAFLASSDHETKGGTDMAELPQFSLKRWRELAKDQRNIRKWLNQHPNNTQAEFDKLSDKDKLNIMYAGKNGNTQPGDGYLFRGRGGMHMTGRDAYDKFSTYMHRPDIMRNPDLVGTDIHLAVQSAIWVWTVYKPDLRKAAQRGDDREVRRIVNGGTIGIKNFQPKFQGYLNGKGALMKP